MNKRKDKLWLIVINSALVLFQGHVDSYNN